MSTGVSNVLKQNAGEVERTLLAVSAEVARNFVGKAEEISTAVSQRAAEMTYIVDEKSSGLLAALTNKSEEFVSEVSRVTEHAVKAIEAKGFNFTQTMMDNSEHIARLISEASETATGVGQSVAQGAADEPHRRDRDHRRSRQPLDPGIARSGGTRDSERREDDHPHAQGTAGARPNRRSSSPRRRPRRPSPRSRRRKTCCGRTRPHSTSACARPTSCCRRCSAARMRT